MEKPKDSGKLPEQKAKLEQASTSREFTNRIPPTIHEKLVNSPVTDHPRTSADVNTYDALSPERIQALVEQEIGDLELEEVMLTAEVSMTQKELDEARQYQEDLKRFLEE